MELILCKKKFFFCVIHSVGFVTHCNMHTCTAYICEWLKFQFNLFFFFRLAIWNGKHKRAHSPPIELYCKMDIEFIAKENLKKKTNSKNFIHFCSVSRGVWVHMMEYVWQNVFINCVLCIQPYYSLTAGYNKIVRCV